MLGANVGAVPRWPKHPWFHLQLAGQIQRIAPFPVSIEGFVFFAFEIHAFFSVLSEVLPRNDLLIEVR